MDYFVLPQYRSLWYHTCYLPIRGFNFAGQWFNNGLNVGNNGFFGGANSGFFGGLNVANAALGTAQNVVARFGQNVVVP